MISMEHFILLSSAIIITCQGTSSTRDNKKGTCKAPVLGNGHHVPNKVSYEVGEWLQYHCDDGYMTTQRNIVEQVQCLSSGWSTVPQCSGITCSFQQKTGSNKPQLVYSNGPVAKFSCNDGFILKGSEISQCYYYGWDPSLPTCEAFDERDKCPPSPQPMNIQVIKLKSDYFNGDKVVMKCKPGFQLNGAESIMCKNGQWTSPPQCIRECDDPPSILFGTLDSATIKPKYHSGSVVRYKCNTGFEITGLHETVCINGSWSLPPACVGDGCVLSKEAMLHNSIRVENAPFKISEGDSVEFQCIGDMVPSQSLSTCKDGKIHYPQCINPDSDSCQLALDKIAQNNLVLPKSASMGKVYRNGERIPARCKTNYFRASPTLTVECLNGKMIYAKCTQEKPCRINQERLDENFLELPNFDYKVYFENEEIIHFKCKAGYSGTDTTGLCIKEDIFYPVCQEI
ncbi:coagulation factor XIII B chain-like [Rhinoderma darwinii]|uniref:coagulation factor XIII B chain-like n=1 Tax=Rhinoderma darwinii TaxID=43563 RepID=UPI003F669CE6